MLRLLLLPMLLLLSVYPASSVSPTPVFTKHSVSSIQIQVATERDKTHYKYEKCASHPAHKQLELGEL